MRFSMVAFICVVISSFSWADKPSKFGVFSLSKSGIQIRVSWSRPLPRLIKYESGIPYTFLAKILTISGSTSSPGTSDSGTQKFCRRKCLKPQKLISLMKLSRKLKGVITITRLPRVPKSASAAAIAEHVLPLPRPW